MFLSVPSNCPNLIKAVFLALVHTKRKRKKKMADHWHTRSINVHYLYLVFNNLRHIPWHHWDPIWVQEVQKLYFVMWHLFSSVSALHLVIESNSRRKQPDAPLNQPVQPQTLAHFQSIGSTQVELPTHSADSIMQPTRRELFGCALVLHTWEQQSAEVQLWKA